MEEMKKPVHYRPGVPSIYADGQLAAIISGETKEASQIVSEDCYFPFVETDEHRQPVINRSVVSDEALEGIYRDCWQFLYNGGRYPLLPKQTPERVVLLDYGKGWRMTNGYDYAVCTVEEMYFRPYLNEKGELVMCRAIGPEDDYEIHADPDGPLCDWEVVFRIGEVLEHHHVDRPVKSAVSSLEQPEQPKD